MTLNPQYLQIGETFVKQYYAIFDGDRTGREKLANFYHAEFSLMSFEGVQVQGAVQIMEKIKALTFQKIARVITTVDCQPMFDGGVLINVLGQLKMDEDPVHGFSQTFCLKPLGDSFFIQHDSFRLVIHNQ
ncbi:probable nuclear transport factor 2 isoform X2 [Hyalella azteca]|uniref:NTF2-related export protein n=1 Tax=Hyalella azteca TaxID=294128 RepID=A0A8B7NWX3_HYAAZ|nr:probable nuclear transport factor 2 isoform X2 [Hyalella azteca]